eukprot:13750135-Heterocapsa_arctica.AAC.1
MGGGLGNGRQPQPRDTSGLPRGQRAPACVPHTGNEQIAGRASPGNSRRVAHSVRHLCRIPPRGYPRGESYRVQRQNRTLARKSG